MILLLAHLPLFDLLMVACRVCRQWRDVVYRSEFMPWKKAYYKYKIDKRYLTILTSNDLNDIPNLEEQQEKGWITSHPSNRAESEYLKIPSKQKSNVHPNTDVFKEPAAKKPKLEEKVSKGKDSLFIGDEIRKGTETNYCRLCNVSVEERATLVSHVRNLDHIKNYLAANIFISTYDYEMAKELDIAGYNWICPLDDTAVSCIEYEKSLISKSVDLIGAVCGWDERCEYDFMFRNSIVNENQCLQEVTSFKVGKVRIEMVMPWMINFVSKTFCSKQNSFRKIIRHPNYEHAIFKLEERMPEVARSSDGEPNYPAVIAVLCCIANSAWDVKAIFDAILNPSFSTCSGHDAAEIMYCVALGFLYFKRNSSELPSRYHYNVFQAIYFFENEFTHTCKLESSAGLPRNGPKSQLKNLPKGKSQGQTSLLSFAGFHVKDKSVDLTAEQARIINHTFDLKTNPCETIRIIAYAGTGKTTTLIQLCKKYPNLRFLVVMYNRSVKDHAITQFPKNNVKCVTTHGMAFKKVGWMFAKTKLTGNLKARDIINSELMADRGDGEHDIPSGATKKKTRVETQSVQRGAAQVLKTIENFMNSMDMELTMENVPSVWQSPGDRAETVIDAQTRLWVLEDAVEVWKAMCDKDNTCIRMPHDGYLKLWHLKKPNLQYFEPHDILLIDEGQDMNPPMLDIFMQQRTPKVVVGDPNQQIYLFRGAVNALETVKSSTTKTYYLTQSFRFGPEIAFAANCALEKLKYKDTQTLVGGKKIDSLISWDDVKTENLDLLKPIAVIGRTNRGVFNRVVQFISEVKIANKNKGKTNNCESFGITDCQCCKKEKQLKACFAGGIESYNLNDYLDLYYLSKGQNERMKKYKGFTSFSSLQAFAKNTKDIELLSRIDIVKTYADKLPNLIDMFSKHCKSDPRQADYIFSTAHKAKGLEWKTVLLMDDFVEIPGVLTNRYIQIEEDEKNLLYVAMSRAKNHLTISKNIFNLLTSNGDFRERTSFVKRNSRSSKEEVANIIDRLPYGMEAHYVEEDANCAVCGTVITVETSRKDTFLYQEHLKVSPYERSSGQICSICSCQNVQSIRVDSNIQSDLVRTVNVLDNNRASLRFICGPLPKDFTVAKDLFRNQGNDIFWQAAVMHGGAVHGLPMLNFIGQIIDEGESEDSE